MTEPSIIERIQAEMVKAMKEKDADTLSTVRMLKAALMEAKTAKPKDATLSRDEEIEILQRYVKKRRETIDMNTKVGRADLNPAEEREIAITQRFLPEMLSEEKLAEIVKAAVASTGAAGPRDMGKVIGEPSGARVPAASRSAAARGTKPAAPVKATARTRTGTAAKPAGKAAPSRKAAKPAAKASAKPAARPTAGHAPRKPGGAKPKRAR